MPELSFYVAEDGDLSDLEGIRKDANIDTLPWEKRIHVSFFLLNSVLWMSRKVLEIYDGDEPDTSLHVAHPHPSCPLVFSGGFELNGVTIAKIGCVLRAVSSCTPHYRVTGLDELFGCDNPGAVITSDLLKAIFP